MAGSASRSRPRATPTSTSITRWRTSGSCSASACARRSATAAASSRFGRAHAPLDEALARAVVDLSGRGFFVLTMTDAMEQSWVTPDFPLTLVRDFFQAFADRGRVTLHLDVLTGRNPHHVAEACFKAVALALRQALALRAAPGRARCRRPRAPVNAMSEIVVVDPGVGNLGNLKRALERVGAPARITDDPAVVASSRRLVLPGVGAFRPPRERLRGALEEALRDALADGAWLLGICVGYQLLFEAATSSAPPTVSACSADASPSCRRRSRCPHIGWNRLHDATGASAARRPRRGGVRLLRAQLRAGRRPRRRASRRVHARPPVRGDLRARPRLGTQFHPEKSGAHGLRLLRNYVELVAGSDGEGAVELLPSIDLRHGRVVRLVRGEDGAAPHLRRRSARRRCCATARPASPACTWSTSTPRSASRRSGS